MSKLLTHFIRKQTKIRYPRFEKRLHQESNLDTPKSLDFKSSAIPLCDEGNNNFEEDRFLNLVSLVAL